MAEEVTSTTPSEAVQAEPSNEEQKTASASNGKQNDADTSAAVISPLEEKIIKQIEFYFGDRNLPRDKFLQQAIASEPDGWVPISTLLTFKRLKALSSEADFITTAIGKTKSTIVELNAEKTSIRRLPDNPLPDIYSPEKRREIKGKTLYVKGFGEDTDLDTLQEFFNKYGQIEYIQMRRTGPPERKFKGSVFVEFKDKSEAEAFLALPPVKFNDTELIKESKDGYFSRKSAERKEKKHEKRPTEEAAVVEEKAKSKESSVKTAGCVLQFKGIGANASREDIKEQLREFASVAYIDFARGDTEGYVRFGEEGGAKKAMDGLNVDGKTQLCGADTVLSILEGEEEESYWDKLLNAKPKKQKGFRKFGGGGGGRSFGYRKRKSRQSTGDGEDTPPVAKQQKTEGGTSEE